MKKLLSISMVLVVILASLLVFASCAGGASLPEAPDGYTWYENNDFYVAYPEAWQKNEENGMVQLAPSAGGNNIVITTAAYDSTFDNITVETIETYLQPSIEAQGMEMTNIAVEHDTTKGSDIAIVTYKITLQSFSMDQTLYMFRVGNTVYSVTLTEAVEDLTFVRTVFNSLTLK